MTCDILADGSSSQDVCKWFNVSRESQENLLIYEAQLRLWQKRINLVSNHALEHLWSRHIGDGLQLVDLLPANCKTIIDLGSGAGIPGIVMAIAMSGDDDKTFWLIESNGKKVAFLREVIRLTKVNAKVFHGRIEEFDSEPYQNCQTIIVSRALANLAVLLDYSADYLCNGATALFHKGQDVDSELTDSSKYWNMTCVKHQSKIDVSSTILHITELAECPTSIQPDSDL